MLYEIKTIAGKIANCYLVKTEGAFFMVDTGVSFSRGALKKTLTAAGCRPGSLKLVAITHADYDHTGSCVYLREKYGAKIAIHRNEAGAVETKNMLANRKNKPAVFLKTMPALFRPLIFRNFKPDIIVDDGDDLSQYGLDARVVHTPGHTTGSISILTAGGDLFCGDFLVNSGKPKKNHLVDDMAAMDASVERLKTLNVKKVYPGHGKPFTLEEFLQ